MAFIIEISGYKAVGKSSLIENLKKRFPDAIFREGFRKFNKECDMKNYQEYINNQKLYIHREIEEFKKLKMSNKFVFLLRGPEEVGFFTRNYPRLKHGFDWHIDDSIIPELKELDTFNANMIIWLEANANVLQRRKELDLTKPRLNMEKWNKTWNPYLGDFIKNLSNTIVLDTNKLNESEVLERVVSLIFENVKKDSFIPERLYIETTNACNARCIMCPHPRMKRKIQTMKDATFEKVIGQLKAIDLSNTTVFMHKEGEPFLDPQIVGRINCIKKNTNAKEIAINTNASLLSKDVVDKLLLSGIDTIYLSIDGTRKETYEKIRIGLNFEDVMKNVYYMFEVLKKSDSQMKVIVQMLVNDSNREEGQLFKKRWESENCEVFVKNMHSYLDGGNSSLTSSLSSKQLYSCSDPFNMLVIYSSGNFGCCCWDYENDLFLGNIEDVPILEAFNSEKINNIRQQHALFSCKNLNPCNRCMRVFGNDEISGLSNDKEIRIK